VKTYIIDRFEDDIAVIECEDKTAKNISCSLLPKGAKPGDVIREDNSGVLSIDIKETNERKKRIKKLMDSLFLD